MFARARARDSQLSALDSATASVLMQDLTHELPSTETDDASARGDEIHRRRTSQPSAPDDEDSRRGQRALDSRAVGTQNQVSSVSIDRARVARDVDVGRPRDARPSVVERGRGHVDDDGRARRRDVMDSIDARRKSAKSAPANENQPGTRSSEKRDARARACGI